MNHEEKQKLAEETYELGLRMNNTFADGGRSRDFMILAIIACISGLTNKPFDLQSIDKFNGGIFKDLRKSKGYTLRQTEDATGISNSYLSQLETGKIINPSHAVVKKLLDFYNHGIYVKSSDLYIYAP